MQSCKILNCSFFSFKTSWNISSNFLSSFIGDILVVVEREGCGKVGSRRFPGNTAGAAECLGTNAVADGERSRW